MMDINDFEHMLVMDPALGVITCWTTPPTLMCAIRSMLTSSTLGGAWREWLPRLLDGRREFFGKKAK